MEKNHRRDALFLTLSGIFLTSLVLGNVIGTTKFVTIFSPELPAWLEALHKVDPGSERTLAAGFRHASRTEKAFGLVKWQKGE